MPRSLSALRTYVRGNPRSRFGTLLFAALLTSQAVQPAGAGATGTTPSMTSQSNTTGSQTGTVIIGSGISVGSNATAGGATSGPVIAGSGTGGTIVAANSGTGNGP